MSQLVLVRCSTCKRRYARHGEGGCPFCAMEGGAVRNAPPTPKVVVHGDAVAEVVRQPRKTPPPQAGKANLAAGSAGPAAPTVSSAGVESAALGERPAQKRRAIILRPSAPMKVGPIVLPRLVWMSIVAIAVLVAVSVMAWDATQGGDGTKLAAVPAAREAQAQSGSVASAGKETDGAARDAGLEAPDGEPAEAPRAAGAVVEEPTTPAGHFRQGTRHFMDGDLAGAQARFEAAVALDPAYCAAHRALGVVHSTRQDSRRSVEAYQRYLQCSPRVSDDAEIQRRIASLGGAVAGDGQR